MLEKDSTNKVARNNIKRRSMGTNKTEANRDTNKKLENGDGLAIHLEKQKEQWRKRH